MSATIHPGRVVPHLLRRAWPRHAAKRAATAAGVSVETARNWVKGRAAMTAETLMLMAARDEALAAALMRGLDAETDTRPRAAAAGEAAARGGALAAAPLTGRR